MTAHISDQFEEAAAFLSGPASSLKVPDNVKLELYALFKCITVSKTPLNSRPSIFDFTGRAKWDAWDRMGKENDSVDIHVLQQRYVDLARSLGWKRDLHPAVTANEHSNADPSSSRGGHSVNGSGMGVGVSVVSQPPLDDPDSIEDTLHAHALSDDPTQLTLFLDSHPDENINALDDFGYTALHLAADRGRKFVVKILLERGADPNVKDPDELTALHLAEICGHDDIISIIREYTLP